jgi:hypothetical protein
MPRSKEFSQYLRFNQGFAADAASAIIDEYTAKSIGHLHQWRKPWMRSKPLPSISGTIIASDEWQDPGSDEDELSRLDPRDPEEEGGFSGVEALHAPGDGSTSMETVPLYRKLSDQVDRHNH